MSYIYPFCPKVNLHVPGRVSFEDAARQTLTAKEILRRLEAQPGVILGDEVGMGKTFVALAAAVSVAVSDQVKRPVIVMVPPSLKEKWPSDLELFKEKCLPRELADQIRYGKAERAEQFLKFLDDPPERQKCIIFITHGTMSRGLGDKWVKLALIYQAVKYRKEADTYRRPLSRILGDLIYMRWVCKTQGNDIWTDLLTTHPSKWLPILQKCEIDPEDDDSPATDDDPVPKAVWEILDQLDTDSVFEALKEIPFRRSPNFEYRISLARKRINEELRNVWEKCIHSLKLKLPLLILDEAHHLKNPETRLASLFRTLDSQNDIENITKGKLAGVFERMLFLTATPFQLGHGELCSVLDRFGGICWEGQTAPLCGKEEFNRQLSSLRSALDAAQESAITLDTTWGLLGREDLRVGDKDFGEVDEWWGASKISAELTPRARLVRQSFLEAQRAMKNAEQLLQPWVIRHLKPRSLPQPYAGLPRRRRIIGRGIHDLSYYERVSGIEVQGDAILPFLLAARAASSFSSSRPVFAEGLASSYEAFLHTRKMHKTKELDMVLDLDEDENSPEEIDEAASWYLDKLETLLPKDDAANAPSHPKLSATVRNAANIWRQGEKVLIFCHFIATGKALRQYISREIDQHIRLLASEKLSCQVMDVPEELERLGRRFFDEDSPVRRACDEEVEKMLAKYAHLQPSAGNLSDLIRRMVRTPSFLVRFFPLGGGRFDAEGMMQALDTADQSGMTLRGLLEGFFEFLQVRCGEKDRQRYIDAVSRIQTGSHFGQEITNAFAEDEIQGERVERLIPNVRLVNGTTKSETRQRLMFAFNTPFYPEILIASSVLAEGVDLQMNCRYINHHDLCWNPSTLEQRTGRIDRVGAKAERCGQSIHIYLPFIAETQDEKMYRVVMDRERWFNIVMGEKFNLNPRVTEKMAERVPLPESLVKELIFHLEVNQH